MDYTSTFGAGNELAKLRSENNALAEELAQCQADKEFVWSLWKRLQVANPDITQAIGMVIQREKEKTEIKDRKVLDILQVKDDKIDELERLSHSQATELKEIRTRKVDAEDKVRYLERDNEELKSQLKRTQGKLDDLECNSRETASRQAVRELDQENMELKQKICKLERDVCDLQRDKDDLQAVKDSHKERIKHLEEDLKEMGCKYDNQVRLTNDAKRESRRQPECLAALRCELDTKTRELEAARAELSEVWTRHSAAQDHATEQAGLIRQLRTLQKDTQAMLKNQEDAFDIEIKAMQNDLKQLQTTENCLRVQLADKRRELDSKDDVVRDLQEQLEAALCETDGGGKRRQQSRGRRSSHGATATQQAVVGQSDEDLAQRLYELQAEVRMLKASLKDNRPSTRDRSVSPMSRDRSVSPMTRDRSVSPIGSSYLSKMRSSSHLRHSSSSQPRRQRSRSLTQSRSRSLGPPGHRSRSPARSSKKMGHSSSRDASPAETDDQTVLMHRLDKCQQKLEQAQLSLHLQSRELDEVRSAHRRRLERLRSLQANNRLMRETNKVLEEEAYGPKKRKKKLKRSDPKSLQKEDSDSVWNELTYFKTQNKNLLVEKMNLEEELDVLRVTTAQDAATIHELKIALDSDREELAELQQQQTSRQRSADTDAELKATTRHLRGLSTRLATMETEQSGLREERDRLREDVRVCKAEVSVLKQQAAKHRIVVADLRRENAHLNREIKKRKKNRKSALAKQYQKQLNESVQRMEAVFGGEFDREQVWEDLSETEETDATTEITGDTAESLGQAIADRAAEGQREVSPGRRGRSPQRALPRLPKRTVESMDEHIRRMGKKNETPTKDHSGGKSQHDTRGTMRDAALSPIRFPAGSSPPPPPAPRRGPQATAARQVNGLKQRVAALTRQVTILKIGKEHATKTMLEQKKAAKDAENELQAAQQKLTSNRLLIQRLSGDIERLRQEKDDLEQDAATTASVDSLSTAGTTQEWLSLNNRLKTTAAEMVRQNGQVKQLRAENSQLQAKIGALQDKVCHLERDVCQKRSLIDDLRIKTRLAAENQQQDDSQLEAVEHKLKLANEQIARLKTQVESFKNRIAAVTKEKYNNEDKVVQLSDEVERKSRQVCDLQKKNIDLQSTVDALERTAQQQLHSLASHSEAAIDTAHGKLTEASLRLQEFHKFVRMFAHSLVQNVQQSRQFLKQQDSRKHRGHPAEDPKLQRAQLKAADILNISQSELSDLMSCDSDDSYMSDRSEKDDDTRRDRKWVKKWERALKTKNDFALALVELFMEKVDERVKLAVNIRAT